MCRNTMYENIILIILKFAAGRILLSRKFPLCSICISVVELCSPCREGKRLVTLAEADEKTEVSKSDDDMSLNKSSWTMRPLDGVSLTDVSRPWTSAAGPVIIKKMMSPYSI